ncbi:type II secretion system protein GspM [Duganella qianjiadongensis]|uniref:Type II secretion system protein M n=1 Tax=Duganella qianjiadongensis TaxID=2692176 RepID=A0ABW9VPV6_9BURK|nr:type II secretion system protein M [Duganella qianjiadongensis]MYM40630.1 type II secretion system protein M [Duganella qianjiadongensis]
MSAMTQMMNDYRARAAAFWSARTEQERTFLRVGGLVLGAVLFYSVLVGPALEGRDKLRKSLPELRQQAAELQALGAQAVALRSQNSIAPSPMSRDTLASSLTTRGLSAQSLSVTGEYAKVQLNGVPFAALVVWLDAVRVESKIQVQDASISAQDSAGMVNATLTLRQSSAGR